MSPPKVIRMMIHVLVQKLSIKNITSKEFMAAARIGRTKFDQLVSTIKIRIIKKRQKIYVPVSEVDRYFTDPGIQ